MTRATSQRGFTLIEMAVVLGIVALIMGSALTMGKNALQAAAQVSTQDRMKTIQTALESYVKANGYLPCPTSRATAPSNSTTFGLEARAGTGCTASAPGLVQIGVAGYIGGVPVRTLGLPDAYAADAWSNKFTYAVSAGQVAGPASYASAPAAISIHYGDRTVVGSNYILSDPTVLNHGATYVLVSHGPDGRGAFPMNGTAVAIPCGTGNQNDVANCDDSDLDFYDDDYNDGKNAAQYFDDYVLWGSNTLSRASSVQSPAECTTGCESWCAQCPLNATIPNSNLPVDVGQIVNPVLCQKIITSTSPCRASCVWSGTAILGATAQYVRCP